MPPLRDGEYGGPLLIFNSTDSGDSYLLISPLNHFMVSNMENWEGGLRFGLMASVESIPGMKVTYSLYRFNRWWFRAGRKIIFFCRSFIFFCFFSIVVDPQF